MTDTQVGAAAWAESVRYLLKKPLLALGALLALSASSGLIVLAALLSWHIHASTPTWLQAQALVLVAGEEGDVELSGMGRKLAEKEGVTRVDFIARDLALQDLALRPGLTATALAELKPNPLPDAFRLYFEFGMSPERIPVVLDHVRKMANVASVQFDAPLYERAYRAQHLFQHLVWVGVSTLVLSWLLALSFTLSGLFGTQGLASRRPAIYSAALLGLLVAVGASLMVQGLSAWLASDLRLLLQNLGVTWRVLVVPVWLLPVVCAAASVIAVGLVTVYLRLRVRPSNQTG